MYKFAHRKDHNEEEEPYEIKSCFCSTRCSSPSPTNQIEAILIEEKILLMNAKDEWGTRNIPRKKEPTDRGTQT